MPSRLQVQYPTATMLSTIRLTDALQLPLHLPTSALFLLRLRLRLRPRETRRATAYERDTSGIEPGYLATWPMGFVLLLSLTGFVIAEDRARRQRWRCMLGGGWSRRRWRLRSYSYIHVVMLGLIAVDQELAWSPGWTGIVLAGATFVSCRLCWR